MPCRRLARRKPIPRRAAAYPPWRSGAPVEARSARDCRAHRSAPGFWWSCRLSNGRSPGFGSPFCALSVTVDLDDCGVDHGVFHVRIVGDGVEQPLPDIRLHPVAEAREYAVPVAQRRRQITPRAAGSGDPQYRLDKLSVVLAAAAGIARLAKTMRLHLRPLGVSQNE